MIKYTIFLISQDRKLTTDNIKQILGLIIRINMYLYKMNQYNKIFGS